MSGTHAYEREQPTVGALLLAAGGSRRLGRAKQLVDWGGRPLLQYVLDRVLTWPVASVTVVLGADGEEILGAVDFGEAVVVLNEDWEEGIASSLRVGLDAMSQTSALDGALVALGDQPSVDDTVVAELVHRFSVGDCRAVVPRYRYALANPVVLDRSLWERFMSLEGDAGGQRLLQAHPEWVCEVHFDLLPPRDIDTEADIGELRPRG
jgi:molybdenum cofactor cytidylyltransferase